MSIKQIICIFMSHTIFFVKAYNEKTVTGTMKKMFHLCGQLCYPTNRELHTEKNHKKRQSLVILTKIMNFFWWIKQI